tara:strand:+ start:494 stop:925 length:432 start_codon:yes stop_codon:yes gene_type:complete
MKVENGQNIKVHYKGTLSDGTEFDNSRLRGETLNFEVGSTTLLDGFNEAVIGMTTGETKTFNIAAADAYGEINSEAFRTIPKDQFGDDFEFEIGSSVMASGPEGQFRATIHDIDGAGDVILNFNHPLAGQDLTFQVEVVEIEN